MNRKLWSLMCVVVVASLLCRVNPASAAEPKKFKPTISANPTTVTFDGSVETAKITLTYNGGPKHPYVEVWVSVNGADPKKVLEDEGDGKGTRTVTVGMGKKYRYILTDFGKELASVEVVTKSKSGDGTKPETTPATKSEDMAKAIVNFAGKKIGQKGLGDGTSDSLAEQALIAAGAKFTRRKDGAVYMGRQLIDGEVMQMGDIILFTNFVIKDGGATLKLGNPDHTAIISNVTGNFVTVIYQDVDGEPTKEKSRVRSKGLDFSKKVSGQFRVYRPVPK